VRSTALVQSSKSSSTVVKPVLHLPLPLAARTAPLLCSSTPTHKRAQPRPPVRASAWKYLPRPLGRWLFKTFPPSASGAPFPAKKRALQLGRFLLKNLASCRRRAVCLSRSCKAAPPRRRVSLSLRWKPAGGLGSCGSLPGTSKQGAPPLCRGKRAASLVWAGARGPPTFPAAKKQVQSNPRKSESVPFSGLQAERASTLACLGHQVSAGGG